jgi:hypothetical protein
MRFSSRLVTVALKSSLASALMLALAGCQSVSMAKLHRPHDRLSPTLALARPEKSARTPSPNSTTHESGIEVVSTEPRRPAFRLGTPIVSRNATQSAPRLAVVGANGRLPSATDSVDIVVDEDTLAHELRGRMDRIFLASATLPGDSVPGELTTKFAQATESSEASVAVEEQAPVIEDEMVPMDSIGEAIESGAPIVSTDEPMMAEGGVPVVVEPLAAGVGPDQRGLWDNFIGRLGAAWYDNSINSEWGFFGTGEYTHQFRNSNWFMHSGVAGVSYPNHLGVAHSVGFSRLAKIVGKRVEKRLIMGFSYDGYYDDGLYGTDNDVYLGQIRGLLGWAICSRWDMGVWAAGGINKENILLPVNSSILPAGRYHASMGDRVAGYTSWHLGQTGIFNITSVGWQDNPTGNFFCESDLYIPLTGSTNFFIGGGYSDALEGSFDANMGLEITWGRTAVARCLARKCRGKTIPKVGMLASDTMPRGSFKREIDPCCVRYRGGWANDTYRSALRVQAPTQLVRQISLEAIPPVLPLGEPVPPDPDDQGGEVCPVTNTNPLETKVDRIQGRPVRESRLSQLQKANGTGVDCPDPIKK